MRRSARATLPSSMATGALTNGEFDALVDRAAASLQRDGVGNRGAVAMRGPSSIEYVAVFVAAVRIGAAACPLAPSSTPEQLAAMVRDCGAGLLFVDDSASRALDTVRRQADRQADRPGRVGKSILRFVARAGRVEAEAGRDRPGTDRSTSSIRPAPPARQRHRAAASHALGPHPPRRGAGLWTGLGHRRLDAALFQHHAGQPDPGAGARRHGRADAQVRCAGFSRAVAEASRDARHAGAGAISPPDGSRRLRHVRSIDLPDEDLHQRAVSART